jgi:peptidyl-prolyl cis-trans isomerase C
MVNVLFITFPRQSDAEEFYQAASSGADFDSLRRVGLQRRILTEDSSRGLVPRGQYPQFDDTLFNMQKGDIVGPMKTEEGYKVLRLLDRAEESMMDWEQAKPYADKHLKGRKAEETLLMWLEDLKDKWGVEIYEENLDLVSLKPKKS